MEKKKSKAPVCIGRCCGAWLPALLLLVGFLWLGNDVNLWNLNLPYLPVVVILATLGMILHHHDK